MASSGQILNKEEIERLAQSYEFTGEYDYDRQKKYTEDTLKRIRRMPDAVYLLLNDHYFIDKENSVWRKIASDKTNEEGTPEYTSCWLKFLKAFKFKQKMGVLVLAENKTYYKGNTETEYEENDEEVKNKIEADDSDIAVLIQDGTQKHYTSGRLVRTETGWIFYHADTYGEQPSEELKERLQLLLGDKIVRIKQCCLKSQQTNAVCYFAALDNLMRLAALNRKFFVENKDLSGKTVLGYAKWFGDDQLNRTGEDCAGKVNKERFRAAIFGIEPEGICRYELIEENAEKYLEDIRDGKVKSEEYFCKPGTPFDDTRKVMANSHDENIKLLSKRQYYKDEMYKRMIEWFEQQGVEINIKQKVLLEMKFPNEWQSAKRLIPEAYRRYVEGKAQQQEKEILKMTPQKPNIISGEIEFEETSNETKIYKLESEEELKRLLEMDSGERMIAETRDGRVYTKCGERHGEKLITLNSLGGQKNNCLKIGDEFEGFSGRAADELKRREPIFIEISKDSRCDFVNLLSRRVDFTIVVFDNISVEVNKKLIAKIEENLGKEGCRKYAKELRELKKRSIGMDEDEEVTKGMKSPVQMKEKREEKSVAGSVAPKVRLGSKSPAK